MNSRPGVESVAIAVLAPLGRDGVLIAELLERNGFETRLVDSVETICRLLEEGACGCVIIAEEALGGSGVERLSQMVSAQGAWSDLPFIVLSGHGISAQGAVAKGLEALGNVGMLDRPVQVRTLLSAVRSAIRARKRQYGAKREIEQRDQFLAMLGHELRNPLAAIMFSLENSRRSQDDAARAKALSIIDRQAHHLGHLVDDLLDVARVTTGRVVLSQEIFEVGDLVRKALQALDGPLRAQRLDVTTDIPSKACVRGDATRIEQVLSNLLTNAIKYTPQGGKIEIRVTQTSGTVEISVRDTGIGIDPNMLPRVFDLFSQADLALDRSQGGMGIGLTVVQRLVELHGGSVAAASEGPGKGSTFVVRLPSVERDSTAPRNTSFVHTAPLRIVLVEDNEDLRESMRELLEDLGHTVLVAEDGEAGASLIISSVPELALIDIGLPVLDGYAVARKVREALGAKVRLAALTGYGQPEDRTRALECGFDAHLKKPVEPAQLNRVIASASGQAA